MNSKPYIYIIDARIEYEGFQILSVWLDKELALKEFQQVLEYRKGHINCIDEIHLTRYAIHISNNEDHFTIKKTILAMRRNYETDEFSIPIPVQLSQGGSE